MWSWSPQMISVGVSAATLSRSAALTRWPATSTADRSLSMNAMRVARRRPRSRPSSLELNRVHIGFGAPTIYHARAVSLRGENNQHGDDDVVTDPRVEPP